MLPTKTVAARAAALAACSALAHRLVGVESPGVLEDLSLWTGDEVAAAATNANEVVTAGPLRQGSCGRNAPPRDANAEATFSELFSTYNPRNVEAVRCILLGAGQKEYDSVRSAFITAPSLLESPFLSKWAPILRECFSRRDCLAFSEELGIPEGWSGKPFDALRQRALKAFRAPQAKQSEPRGFVRLLAPSPGHWDFATFQSAVQAGRDVVELRNAFGDVRNEDVALHPSRPVDASLFYAHLNATFRGKEPVKFLEPNAATDLNALARIHSPTDRVNYIRESVGRPPTSGMDLLQLPRSWQDLYTLIYVKERLLRAPEAAKHEMPEWVPLLSRLCFYVDEDAKTWLRPCNEKCGSGDLAFAAALTRAVNEWTGALLQLSPDYDWSRRCSYAAFVENGLRGTLKEEYVPLWKRSLVRAFEGASEGEVARMCSAFVAAAARDLIKEDFAAVIESTEADPERAVAMARIAELVAQKKKSGDNTFGELLDSWRSVRPTGQFAGLEHGPSTHEECLQPKPVPSGLVLTNVHEAKKARTGLKTEPPGQLRRCIRTTRCQPAPVPRCSARGSAMVHGVAMRAPTTRRSPK